MDGDGRNAESHRRAIKRALSKAFKASGTPTVDVDVGDLRWVVFSDHHKGERDGADFRRCERFSHAALGAYLERGYSLVALGDVDERWECFPEKLLEDYEHTLALEREFHDAGRYARSCGNHDDTRRHTGCCSFVDGDRDVTGIELTDGEIRLVRWSRSEGAPARRALASDSLADVLASVAGRVPVPTGGG
jgi:hypothetical protein